jgi:hypothetical protein
MDSSLSDEPEGTEPEPAEPAIAQGGTTLSSEEIASTSTLSTTLRLGPAAFPLDGHGGVTSVGCIELISRHGRFGQNSAL